MQLPTDLVEVGHISGAYGVHGWIRVRPYSAEADALLAVREWWLDSPEWHVAEVMQARWHGDEIVARLAGVSDRNAAEALRGSIVHISRHCFPVLGENEYYWVDLIGLSVFNLREEYLGTVRSMMDNGAHSVLQVCADMPDGGKKELLIPFVDSYVGKVDCESRKITVDWEPDY